MALGEAFLGQLPFTGKAHPGAPGCLMVLPKALLLFGNPPSACGTQLWLAEGLGPETLVPEI